MPTLEELSKWVNDLLKKGVLRDLETKEKEACEEILEKFNQLQSRLTSDEAVSRLSQGANKFFQQVFPGLALDIEPSPNTDIDLSKALEKEFTVTVRDGHHPNVPQHFQSQGHGVIRQIMFNFLARMKSQLSDDDQTGHARKDFLILFEEPEIYLHPKSIRMLQDTLYHICADSPFQALCASHSPLLVDISRPHTSLARVVRSGVDAVVFQAGDDLFAANKELKQRVQMLNRFNPHLAETFFADEVILVEGDTDAIVVRTLLETMAPHRDIFVLNTGSKTNIPFFQRILTHFHIQQHVIHDSDYPYARDNEGSDFKRRGDGEPVENPAWSHNDKIWGQIENANKVSGNGELARRYVLVENFEDAHGYSHDEKKGKPLSAFEFDQSLSAESDQPIVKVMAQILGQTKPEADYSPEELQSLVGDLTGAARST
jgi:predicted ATP-dependent endonuclease of OLD family